MNMWKVDFWKLWRDARVSQFLTSWLSASRRPTSLWDGGVAVILWARSWAHNSKRCYNESYAASCKVSVCVSFWYSGRLLFDQTFRSACLHTCCAYCMALCYHAAPASDRTRSTIGPIIMAAHLSAYSSSWGAGWETGKMGVIWNMIKVNWVIEA